MASFRARDVVVQAEQFYFSKRPWPNGAEVDVESQRAYVDMTYGQRVELRDGDWVITNQNGVYQRVVNAAEFAASYAPLTE